MSSSLLPLPDCHLQLLCPAPLALQPAAHVAQLGLQPLGLGLLHMGSEQFNYGWYDPLICNFLNIMVVDSQINSGKNRQCNIENG